MSEQTITWVSVTLEWKQTMSVCCFVCVSFLGEALGSVCKGKTSSCAWKNFMKQVHALKEHFIRLLLSTCSLWNVLQLQQCMVLLGEACEKSEDFIHEGISSSCPSVRWDPVHGFQAGKGECITSVSCHIFGCDITVKELKGFTKVIIFLNIDFTFWWE